MSTLQSPSPNESVEPLNPFSTSEVESFESAESKSVSIQETSSVEIGLSGTPVASDSSPVEQVHNVSSINDDDNTQPSSTANNEEPVTSLNPSPFFRFIQNTRKHLSRKDSDDLADGAVISGCLHKLGRNGKWQMRWFESDGECLSYYKSSKRVKLLATLDLEKVSAHSMVSIMYLHSLSYRWGLLKLMKGTQRSALLPSRFLEDRTI